MLIVIVIVTGCIVARFLPQVPVWMFAMIITLHLASNSKRVGREILKAKASAPGWETNYYRRPTAAERRLLKRELRLALSQTELRSLFPNVARSADLIAAAANPRTNA